MKDQQTNSDMSHTNETRNNLNDKISRYKMLGKTKKVQWSDKRRFRNI